MSPRVKLLLVNCGHFTLPPVQKLRPCFAGDSSGGMCTGDNDPSLKKNWKLSQKIVHMMAWQEKEVEIKKQINRVGAEGLEWTD